jgi:hypothetical protein
MNNNNNDFNWTYEMQVWTTQELGRTLTKREWREIRESVENNKIYNEFFDSLESILLDMN